jgi:hypothetical protein
MMKKHTYTDEELDCAALRDQINDAECSERQAESGPYFPDRGITKESLLAYAAKCRSLAAQYATGGAHAASIRGA